MKVLWGERPMLPCNRLSFRGGAIQLIPASDGFGDPEKVMQIYRKL
jgi:hypothetical protein